MPRRPTLSALLARPRHARLPYGGEGPGEACERENKQGGCHRGVGAFGRAGGEAYRQGEQGEQKRPASECFGAGAQALEGHALTVAAA